MPLDPLEHSFQASLQSKMTTSLDGQPASGHEKPQQLYLLGFACKLSSQGMNFKLRDHAGRVASQPRPLM